MEKVTHTQIPDETTLNEIVKENELLKRELVEIRETAAVQASLYEIAELHSAIYRIADITGNASDMQRFGELLHGAMTELVDADTLLIAATLPSGTIAWTYQGGTIFPELPSAGNGSIFTEIIQSGQPRLLEESELKRIRETDPLIAKARPLTILASAPFSPQGKKEGTVILAGGESSRGQGARFLNMAVFIARHMGTILERKLMHEILTRSRDELESAVKERAAEIVDTNKRLVQEMEVREENERLRSALLSITDCASDTLSVEELCQEIHAIIGSVIYAPNFTVDLVDEGNMLLGNVYFSDQRSNGDYAGSKLFNALNRYVFGTQKASCFSKDSFPASPNGLPRDRSFPASWIGAPLRLGGPPFGVVSIHSYDATRVYTDRELGMLSSLAPQIASTLDRARMHDKLRKYQNELELRVEARTRDLREANEQLTSIISLTVDVLSSASEIRDPYTAGHQKRVTKIALKIAERLHLAEERMEGIRIAGTLHDFGKISVPIEILTKPGHLNELETEFVHTHSQTGYDILKIIPFRWPVAEIVRQHHERLDGSGYPRGISGNSILLESRILTVADVVEAISSHRPYRASLGVSAAIEEITNHRGTYYDPDVVDACIALLLDPDEDIS